MIWIFISHTHTHTHTHKLTNTNTHLFSSFLPQSPWQSPNIVTHCYSSHYDVEASKVFFFPFPTAFSRNWSSVVLASAKSTNCNPQRSQLSPGLSCHTRWLILELLLTSLCTTSLLLLWSHILWWFLQWVSKEQRLAFIHMYICNN